jgi:hypothetical protein
LKAADRWIVKLNTDGACKGRITAGCGGIIRNNRGDWLGGFAKHIGTCSAFTTKLWGVLEGLRYAWSMSFRLVELDVDSMAVVKVIKTGVTTSVAGDYYLLDLFHCNLSLFLGLGPHSYKIYIYIEDV